MKLSFLIFSVSAVSANTSNHGLSSFSPGPSCTTPIDFALLIDESGSMKKPKPDGSMEGPEGAKNFTKSLVNKYFPGKNPTRFSVVSFASVATTRVQWSNNPTVINASIDQMEANGKTNIAGGFDAVRKLFADDVFEGDGSSRPKIVLLLLDGEQSDKVYSDDGKTAWQTAVDAAARVKGDGVTVFAWGFGEKVSNSTLQQIATDKSKATLANDISELSSHLIRLEAAVCNRSRP